MVLVTFTYHMPCASLPSSFGSEVLLVSQYFSLLMRSRYSRACPVTSSITDPAKNLLICPFIQLEVCVGLAESFCHIPTVDV